MQKKAYAPLYMALFIHWNTHFFSSSSQNLAAVWWKICYCNYLWCSASIPAKCMSISVCSSVQRSFGQVQWFIQNENGQSRTTMVDEKKKKKSERKLEHSKLNFLRPHFQCSKMKLKQKWKFYEFFMTNTVADNDHDYMHDTLDVAGGMANIFAVSWQSAQPCLHIMTHPP